MSRAGITRPFRGSIAARVPDGRMRTGGKFAPPLRVGLALLAVVLGWVGPVRGQATQEYDLKAVLLFNFTQFVEWPPTAFANEGEPFVIGVLGRDPFGKTLDDTVRNEKCGKRRIEVARFSDIEAVAVRRCHLLYVSESESANLERIFAVLDRQPVLTVGDFEGFALRGGMMRFKKSPEGKIQLRINLDAVKAANLSVSAKLLRIAEIVRTAPN
jgi:hypothetical protein